MSKRSLRSFRIWLYGGRALDWHRWLLIETLRQIRPGK
jgi:hypothetical protein